MLSPQLRYPAELPVSQHREKILASLSQYQVVVVCGETGSGKTTQLPKLALESAWARFGKKEETGAPKHRGKIGCTQPRRLAATSVAQRVADELRLELGNEIGVQVRFHQKTSAKTAVKFMTDGILLAEIRNDPELKAYHTIILDEVHERSKNLDFLLGYLKTLLPKRPDLQLILSSATLEVERFRDFFGGEKCCPILQIEGRSYPVEIEYHLPDEEDDFPHAVAKGVDLLHQKNSSGDILVFLPGEREIREVSELLEVRWKERALVLPLYARLGLQNQQQIFRPGAQRRIILATNIAETSLTIPRIDSVLDTGLHRISRWSASAGIQRLVLEFISQANARQRAGRCGRLGPGNCLRLYSEEEFEEAFPFPEPEIRRTSLAGTILAMKELGLPDLNQFPLLDPPAPKLVSEGMRELQRLGALDKKREITPIGIKLAKLPLDPPLARFLLAASEGNLVQDQTSKTTQKHIDEDSSLASAACVLAAALTVQDPRERPAEKKQQADKAHAAFVHPDSDFIFWLNLWKRLAEFREQKKWKLNKLRKFCTNHFFNFRRILEWDQLAKEFARTLATVEKSSAAKRASSLSSSSPAVPSRQVDLLLDKIGVVDPEKLNLDALHIALLHGIAYNIGCWDKEKKQYQCPRQAFALFPGSALFQSKKHPIWVLGWDLATTSRTWARQAARIQPQWLEQAAPHLCKHHYHSPRFDPAQGAVYALEHVHLGPLRIIENRPVHYGKINPKDAHEIFVREGVLGEGLTQKARFLEVLADRVYQAQSLDARLRRAGQLFSEDLVEAWFLERIPEEIHTAKQFRQWRAKAEAANPELLHIPLQECLLDEVAEDVFTQFPDEVIFAEEVYPVYWAHEYGSRDDGATIGIHIDQLSTFPSHAASWAIPGLLRQRVEQLLRSLPKSLRVSLQPYSSTCEEFLLAHAEEETRQVELLAALITWLRKEKQLQLYADQLKPEAVSAELEVKLWVCDDEGEELAFGVDVGELQSKLGVELETRANKQAETLYTSSADTKWSFGEIPETTLVETGYSSPKKLFPCLFDQGEAVCVTAVTEKQVAENNHRAGLARLVALQHPEWQKNLISQRKKSGFSENKSLAKSSSFQSLTSLGQLTQKTAKLIEAKNAAVVVKEEVLFLLALESCFVLPLPRDASGFALAEEEVRGNLFERLEKLRAILAQWNQSAFLAQTWIQTHLETVPIDPPAQHISAVDLKEQGMWANHSSHFASGQGDFLFSNRAIQAKSLALRLQKAQEEPLKDMARVEQFRPFWQRWFALWQQNPEQLVLREHGHLLDQWRVALFTPELPRQVKISEKRLEKHWQSLQ